MSDELRRLFDKYVVKIQEFKKVSKVKELVPISELSGVRSLTRLFDVFATKRNGVSIQVYSLGSNEWLGGIIMSLETKNSEFS